MEKQERRILTYLQSKFLVVNRPYLEIANRLHISQQDLITSIRKLKKDKVVRRIGAVFDSRQLGYITTLIAVKTQSDQEEKVAKFINQFSEVTQSYGRENDYNIWFHLVAESDEKVAMILSKISALGEVDDIWNLPAINLFKVKVGFDYEKSVPIVKDLSKSEEENINFFDKDIDLIKLLQQSLPLTSTPFKSIAKKLELSPDQVIRRIKDWQEVGVIRRIGAVVDHHVAGNRANAMVVWRIPKAKVKKTGQTMAEFKEVTNCYERPTFPGWDYNIYTMVNGRNRKICQETVANIAKKVHIKDYKAIYSSKLYKKVSMKYFV